MSVPQGVIQAVAWQDKHPRLVDAGVAAAILLLSLPLALAPLWTTQVTFPPSPWKELTAATCLLCCLVLVLRLHTPLFLATYGLMLLGHAAYLFLALPYWYRQMRRL